MTLSVQPAIALFDTARGEACGVAPVGVADPTFFAPVTKVQREAGGVRGVTVNDAGQMVDAAGTVGGVPVGAVTDGQGVTTLYGGDAPLQIGTSAADSSWKQSGTGAINRTVDAKLKEFVSVRDFGAVGDGVADDTAAIVAAISAMASGGALLFPPGTYKITSSISKTFTDGVNFRLVGYGAKIDGTSVTGSTAGDTVLLTLGGQRLTSSLLSADTAKGGFAFTTASAIGSVAGEVALITSTDLWNPIRAYYSKGELVEVYGVSGTTYNVSNPLFDGYVASTTTAYRLAMPTIEVEGLEFVMNSSQTALSVSYSRNPSVKNCKIHGARYTGVIFWYCLGGTATFNEIYDAWYSGTGTSYCICVASCQGLIVAKNKLSQARHCITSGGKEPNRNLTYEGNFCKVHPLQADTLSIDMHGNTELSSIVGNICEGIDTAGINLTIRGNIITGNVPGKNGIYIYQECNADFYIVQDNTIINPAANSIGVFCSPTLPDISIALLEISGNYISCGYAILLKPNVSTATGCSIDVVSMKNNVFISLTNQAFCLNNAIAATYTVGRIESAANIFNAKAHDAFAVLSGNPVGVTKSIGDTFIANRNNGYLAQFSGTDVELTSPKFKGNSAGAGNSRSVRYTNSGKTKVINPTFENVTYKAELDTGGPSLYVENGWDSATPTIVNTSGARLVNFFGALGRAISYGTAAPATGTWAVGDRVYNQAPAVGAAKSWVCTAAGTPGTWVSEGNL